MATIDVTKVTVLDIQNIHHWDRPDYCDAFIAEAEIDGRPCTDEELDLINADSSFVHESIWEWIH